MRIDYFLSSEEFDPRELIKQARRPEDTGFDGLCISDRFHRRNDKHPWILPVLAGDGARA